MSAADLPDPRTFYTRTVPEEFNRMLAEQEAQGEAGSRVHRDMLAVNGTIRIDVRAPARAQRAKGERRRDGPGSAGPETSGEEVATFFLNIEGGRMTPGDAPRFSPFMRVIQDETAFRRLARETIGSVPALLGALAGLAGSMKLTRKRMRDMEAVAGLIRFEVTGENGFSLLTHFGAGPLPDEPDATIRMGETSYRDLRAGRLDPQTAFLEDAIDAEGDMQKVMQLAFAAVAPD